MSNQNDTVPHERNEFPCCCLNCDPPFWIIYQERWVQKQWAFAINAESICTGESK